jgi:hypothetical protein
MKCRDASHASLTMQVNLAYPICKFGDAIMRLYIKNYFSVGNFKPISVRA